MISLVLIAALAVLLVVLFGAAASIVVRAKRPTPKAPPFGSEFIDELTRLSETLSAARPPAREPVEVPSAYDLHTSGESAFRIAAQLGISKADADLLIKVEEALRRESSNAGAV